MINFLRVGRTPRSFAASMAGLRQGLASAAPGGPKRSGGRCRPEFLGSARNGRSPGEETWGEPLQQGGKRRSRPLPTKAINEAVGERSFGQSYTKEIWQGWECAFNVWLTGSVRNWYVGLAEPRPIPCRCCAGRQCPVARDFYVLADRAVGRKYQCRP
jgi:hypothetical protein